MLGVMAALVTVSATAPVTVKLTGPKPRPGVGVCAVATPVTVFGWMPETLLVTATMTVQPPDGKLGIVRLSALAPVAPIANAGLLVTPTQVPPIAAELMLILVNVSAKVALVNAVALVLPKVNTKLLVPPVKIDGVPKALVIVGLGNTVNVAVEPAPGVVVCVVTTPLTVLAFTPRFELVTAIATVHPPGARLGSVRLSAVAPTVKLGLLLTPTQVPPMLTDATLILTKVSVKLALVKMLVLALPKLKVMVLTSPAPILEGEKDLAMVGGVGGAAVTIKLAEATLLALALMDITLPVVLTKPGAGAVITPVTCTTILQLPLAGTVAPLRPTDASPATLPELIVPPQLLLKFGVANTFMPDGKISLNCAPVIACAEGLVITRVIVLGVLATTVPGAKLLLKVGAAKRTARGALAATVLPPALAVAKKPTVGDAGMVLT